MQQAQPPSGPRHTAFPAPTLIERYSVDADIVAQPVARLCSLFIIEGALLTMPRTFTLGIAPTQEIGDLAIVQVLGALGADLTLPDGLVMPSLGSLRASFVLYSYTLAGWIAQVAAFGGGAPMPLP